MPDYIFILKMEEMLGRKSLCLFIHFLQKASLVILPTRENVNRGVYKLLFQFIHICKSTWMFILQDDLGVHLLCGIWNIQHMMKTCWNMFLTSFETLAVLHSGKLTRKYLLPGMSLQKTGCMFLSFIVHPFLGPQSSDMCSYFEFYLNGNVKLIKIQDQWNVNNPLQ